MGDLVEKTLEPTKKALADAKLSSGDIHEVVMVGGKILVQGTPDEVGRDPVVREVYLGKAHARAA